MSNWKEVWRMNPKIIYPLPDRQRKFYRYLRNYSRYAFIVSSLICLLVNYLVKGKAWSIIVVWSLFSIWRLFFSLRLVEFSIYGHAIKVTLYLVVLLILIDSLLAPGWAQTVVPIVLFAYFLIMIILYFVIYSRKQRHLLSVMMLGLLNLVMIPYSIHSWPIENWLAFAFEISSLVLFIIMTIVNWKDIKYEIKARFLTGAGR